MKEQTDVWLEIQNDVRDDFLEVVTQRELAAIATALKLNVPGFTRNYTKAPMGILKRVFERDFIRMRQLRKFLIDFTKRTYKELKNVPYEEGIKRIAANHQLTKADTVALIGLLYGEHYMELRENFNKESDGALLVDVVDVSLVDIAEVLLQNYESIPEDFANLEALKQDESLEEQSLTEFMQDYNIETQFVARTLYDEVRGEGLSEEERQVLVELANRELMFQQVKSWKKIDELETEQEAKEKEIEHLAASLAKQSAAVEKAKDALQEQVALNEKAQELAQEVHKEEQAGLQEQLEEVTEKLEVALTKQQSLFQTDDDFVVFTKRKESFKQYVPVEDLYTIETVESYLKGNNTERNLFVDAYLLSTDEQIKIEKLCKQYEVKIPIINGDMTKLIRTIIFHLEGVSLV